ANEAAAKEGRQVIFIASVTGTEGDPQNLTRSTETLKAAGVIVCNSNAAASRLTALMVS
ncbi:MAG: acyl-CoA synthetase FdrA, partial [Anaerolineaceae bacterium]|nr:acyl-CoA synthetase FdrA [Anaerolineaceae bacterium]